MCSSWDKDGPVRVMLAPSCAPSESCVGTTTERGSCDLGLLALWLGSEIAANFAIRSGSRGNRKLDSVDENRRLRSLRIADLSMSVTAISRQIPRLEQLATKRVLLGTNL